MRTIAVIVSFLALTHFSSLADPIFDDVEVLEGFENFRSTPVEFNLNPEDEDHERKHLLTHFMTKAIRNKREAKYKILESLGLRSHFHIEDIPLEEIDENPDFVRVRRSLEATTVGKELITKDSFQNEELTTIPELPTPEKLIQKARFYEDHWSQYDKPRDSEAEASVYNEGIKARAPRVNFITKHQTRNGKNLDASESRDTKNSILPETTTQDNYRKNLAQIYLDYSRPYDAAYSRAAPPGPYDPFFGNRRNYDDYYDSYMPRTLSYPNFYYYPDKRYDVPGPRLPYMATPVDNTNSGNAPVPFTTHELPPLSPENRNRRIIYYTTLPEIVRARIPLETYLRSFYRYTPTPYNYYNYLTPHIIPPVSPYFFVPMDPYKANRITRDYTKAIGSITQIRDMKDEYSKKNGNNNGYYNKNSGTNNGSSNNNGNKNNNGRSDGKNDERSKNGRNY